MENTPDGYVIFIAKHSGKALTVGGSSKADGAEIVQLVNQNQDNQKWKIEKMAK
jgi:hypothetical protein